MKNVQQNHVQQIYETGTKKKDKTYDFQKLKQ